MSFNREGFVYHVTTTDRATRCLAEGILPNLDNPASAKSRQSDADYDSARPDYIRRLGAARTSSVYAHLSYEKALARRNGGWLNRAQEKLAILAICVPDPDEVFVAEGLLSVRSFRNQTADYWASLMTLKCYRQQEEPTFDASDWMDSGHKNRYVYMWPEVLLPEGVRPENVTWDGISYRPDSILFDKPQ